MPNIRTWMIRSFALTISIIVSRLLGVPAIIALAPQIDTTFGGSEQLTLHSATSISVWERLVVSLVLAQWAIDRGNSTTRRR